VVLDQYLLETEPDEAETTIEQMDTAILVQVNLAVSGKARLLREVRAALQCRQREEGRARRAAISQLYSELNDTVTALLLSSELVLETVGPRTAGRTAGQERLQSLHEPVKKLRRQLETAAPPEECEAVELFRPDAPKHNATIHVANQDLSQVQNLGLLVQGFFGLPPMFP
jgi:hypothetical protein